MTYTDILEIYNQYQGAEPKNIKNNLYNIMRETNTKRAEIIDYLGIDYNLLQNYLSEHNSRIIPFDHVLRICILFDITIEELIEDSERMKNRTRGAGKRWTEEVKEEYIKHFEKYGQEQTAKRYGITNKSALTYYQKFKNEI